MITLNRQTTPVRQIPVNTKRIGFSAMLGEKVLQTCSENSNIQDDPKWEKILNDGNGNLILDFKCDDAKNCTVGNMREYSELRLVVRDTRYLPCKLESGPETVKTFFLNREKQLDCNLPSAHLEIDTTHAQLSRDKLLRSFDINEYEHATKRFINKMKKFDKDYDPNKGNEKEEHITLKQNIENKSKLLESLAKRDEDNNKWINKHQSDLRFNAPSRGPVNSYNGSKYIYYNREDQY